MAVSLGSPILKSYKYSGWRLELEGLFLNLFIFFLGVHLAVAVSGLVGSDFTILACNEDACPSALHPAPSCSCSCS
ncbi:hypothetical protein GUJ93_ZPchr0252g33446 [Zizania palustris]|uniref:Uncharacterized protein n=1 Tax=Zizania palustris TaxID=103762 RepID=A0A8J5V323_ZIZPA|nr:hypothetical protein GUJ93_ZPchr0252g33446 [Zizania palustris]